MSVFVLITAIGVLIGVGILGAEILARRNANDASSTGMKRVRLAAIAFLGMTPFGIAMTYAVVGTPSMIIPPAAPDLSRAGQIAAAPPAERQAMIEGMVDGLEVRMQTTPDDIEGWRMLARSQTALARFDAAKASYRRLLALAPDDVRDWRNYAGVFVAETRGAFTEDEAFVAALHEIEARAPDDPMAHYFLAGVARLNGENDEALRRWRAMLATMAPDEPARAGVERLIAETKASSVPE